MSKKSKQFEILNEVAALMKFDESLSQKELAKDSCVAGMALILHLLEQINEKEIQTTGKPLTAANREIIDFILHALNSGLDNMYSRN